MQHNHLDLSELETSMEQEEAKFLERFKDVEMTLLIDDSDYESGTRGLTAHHLDAHKALLFLGESDYTNGDCLSKFTDITTLSRGLLNTSDFAIACLPTSEWKRQESDLEREELEAFASQITAQYKIKPYSLGFLDAIEEEKSKWNELTQGLYEDGLCAGDGTQSGWHDLKDGYGEEWTRLDDLQKWLEQNLPLLWAQWSEAKATKN